MLQESFLESNFYFLVPCDPILYCMSNKKKLSTQQKKNDNHFNIKFKLLIMMHDMQILYKNKK